MARGFGLRDTQALVDVADADLPGQEQPQNPKPRHVTEGFENLFHLEQRLAHIFVLTNIITDA
jgi:hypothetical protein